MTTVLAWVGGVVAVVAVVAVVGVVLLLSTLKPGDVP